MGQEVMRVDESVADAPRIVTGEGRPPSEAKPDALSYDKYDRDDENIIGQVLRTRRRMMGLRQEDIASRMGVSRGLVSQWEKGTTRIMARDLNRLGDALGVPAANLFNDTLSNMMWVSPKAHAAKSAEEMTDIMRLEHQEKILLSLFYAMTDDERERLLRVAQALRG